MKAQFPANLTDNYRSVLMERQERKSPEARFRYKTSVSRWLAFCFQMQFPGDMVMRTENIFKGSPAGSGRCGTNPSEFSSILMRNTTVIKGGLSREPETLPSEFSRETDMLLG